MNPNWDPWVKAIFPLCFMAVWFLISMFNRYSQPKSPTGRVVKARGRSPLRETRP